MRGTSGAKSPFLRSVMVLASGAVIAQAIPIVFTPVLSRIFTPEDFGTLGLFVAFVSVASVAVGLSFPLAIVSGHSKRTSAQLALLSFGVMIPMAFVLSGVLFALRAFGLMGFDSLPLISVLWAWLCLVFIGSFVTLRYWQVLNKGFGTISRASVSQSLGRVGTQLLTGAASIGGAGLLFSEVVGRSMGVLQLARKSVTGIREEARGSTRSDYKLLAIEFRKFPILSTPSSLLDSLSQQLPVPLLVMAFSLHASGQFSMAYRVLALPLAVVGAAVADVFHGQIAAVAKQDIATARKLFIRVGAGLLLIGLIPSIVVMIWGPQLFSLVLGNQWSMAGSIASGIMPWLLASFVVGPLTRVVLVFRGQGSKLIYDVLAVSGIVGVILVGSHLGWSIETISSVLGVSQSAAYLVYLLLLWRILSQQNSPESNNSSYVVE